MPVGDVFRLRPVERLQLVHPALEAIALALGLFGALPLLVPLLLGRRGGGHRRARLVPGLLERPGVPRPHVRPGRGLALHGREVRQHDLAIGVPVGDVFRLPLVELLQHTHPVLEAIALSLGLLLFVRQCGRAGLGLFGARPLVRQSLPGGDLLLFRLVPGRVVAARQAALGLVGALPFGLERRFREGKPGALRRPCGQPRRPERDDLRRAAHAGLPLFAALLIAHGVGRGLDQALAETCRPRIADLLPRLAELPGGDPRPRLALDADVAEAAGGGTADRDRTCG